MSPGPQDADRTTPKRTFSERGRSAPASRAVSTAAVLIFAAPRRAVAGIEVAGNDDADRFYPARDVGDAAETAFGQEFVVVAPPCLGPRWLAAGLLDPEKFEPFVVLVVASGHRDEVVPPATRQARRRPEFRFGAATASPRSTPRRAAPTLRLGPFRGRLSRGAGGTRRRAFPVAPTSAAAATRFPFASTAVGSGAGRSGGPAVAGGEWFIVRSVIASAHRGRFVSGLFRGGAIFAGPFPATTTAATTTAPAPAAASRLLVAGVSARLPIRGAAFTPTARLADRLAGLQVDAPPVVVVPLDPSGRRTVGALGTRWSGTSVGRCIPIKTSSGGRLLATRRLAAELAVAVAGGAPFPVVLAARGGGRTPLLTGRVLGGTPRLKAELVVAAVVGPIFVLGAASRSLVIGTLRGPFAPRCVVAIPSSAPSATAASPAATATPRFSAAPVPLGAIAIFEDPGFRRIGVVDLVVILTPAGVAIPGPGGLAGRIATLRRTERVWTGLVGSGVNGTLGTGAIPGRAPRGIARFGAFATPSVTAASPAGGTATVPTPFAATVLFPSARSRTVGRAAIRATVSATIRPTIHDRAIVKTEVVGAPIGGDVARREIPGGSLRLRETFTAAVLPFRTALERLWRRHGRPFAGCGRRWGGRGGAGRNRVWLEAQA